MPRSSVIVLLTVVLHTGMTTAAEVELRWSVELPARQTKWRFVRDMQKDSTYQATVAGGLAFIGCEHNGAVLALDAKTGEEQWRFYTNGAVRTQPAADDDFVLVGSDDGYVYCLNHAGELRWKAPLGPGQRFVIGHQRLTSAWPVPTHPLLADGVLYIMGGCWPADGVYMQAFDVASGERLWKSPSMAMRAMMIPHWIDDGHVFVRTYSGTGGRAARFDIKTGDAHPWPKGYQTPKSERPEVPGSHDLAGSNEAGGLLFGTSGDGTLYCAGPSLNSDPRTHERKTDPPAGNTAAASAIIEAAGHSNGFALVDGLTDGSLVEGLLRESELYVVAIDADHAKVNRIRRDLDQRACFDTHRLSVLALTLAEDMLPPYFASVVLSESGKKPSEVALQSLRPFGGAALQLAGGSWNANKRGALEGAGNWSHEYANASMNNSTSDTLVKAPLGVLWYGGPASDRRFYLSGNRPAGGLIYDGRMFVQGLGVIGAFDAYTGVQFWEAEIPRMHIYNGTHGGGGGGLSKSKPWIDEAAAKKGIPPIQRARATGLNWAVTADCLYVFSAHECLRFDPVTGEALSAWRMPLEKINGEELCWGHPRIVDDVLVATAFRPSDMRDARIGIGANGGDWTGDRMPMSHVFAMKRSDGTVLWSQSANLGFNNRAFVAANDRVFCTDLLQTVAAEGFIEAGRKIPDVSASLRAFDLKTGEEVWTKKLQRLVKYINFQASTDTLFVPNRYGRTWTGNGWGWPGLSERETRSKSGRPNGIFRAFRGQTGEMLWEVSEQQYDGPFTVLADRILNRYGTAFDPQTGKLALRVSPLTGQQESYGFKKSGCAVLGACDSIVAWRTAYHDMNTGTSRKLAGFEAGCTTSLLPASGMLNLPNFGLFHLRARAAALSMVHRPSARPWTSYQMTKPKQEAPLQRIGFNFTAPGDRYDDNGTLWMQAYRGDAFKTKVEPATHVRFLTGNESDWIRQSGVEGASRISIVTALNQKSKAATRYDVRLHFSARGAKPGQRVFDIAIEGQQVVAAFDPGKANDAELVQSFEGVEISGTLDIDLIPVQGQTVLCGVELIRRDASGAER